MKISEILHKAADEHLWDGVSFHNKETHDEFSCIAVMYAHPKYYPAIDFLKSLGG